jgi:hypothetical protein
MVKKNLIIFYEHFSFLFFTFLYFIYNILTIDIIYFVSLMIYIKNLSNEGGYSNTYLKRKDESHNSKILLLIFQLLKDLIISIYTFIYYFPF